MTEQLSLSPSFEELMLKLKLQYFDYLMQRTDSLEKTLKLGKIEGRRRRGQQRIKWLVGTTVLMYMSLSMFEQAPGDGKGQGRRCAAVHGVAKSQT